VKQVTLDDVAKGYLLKADGDDQIRAAEMSQVGNW
jgi:hypothetical protein